jgi:hypothetical protein
MSVKSVRWLFTIAGLYDIVLGAAFLVAGGAILTKFGVTLPPHDAYLQFPALLLVVFGLMFLAVAARPHANRNLIFYGLLMKLSYGGVILWHWVGTSPGIDDLWKPFAVLDVIWAALFLWAYGRLGGPAEAT